MIDLGISKLALIGAVALIVIGPEKLPQVAKTLGALIGKARRYINDVKNEVHRVVELESLKDLGHTAKQAAEDIEQAASRSLHDLQAAWQDNSESSSPPPLPQYQHPKKNWRLKKGATPMWFKAQAGIRRQAQSGAARVARHRSRHSPKRLRLPAGRWD